MSKQEFWTSTQGNEPTTISSPQNLANLTKNDGQLIYHPNKGIVTPFESAIFSSQEMPKPVAAAYLINKVREFLKSPEQIKIEIDSTEREAIKETIALLESIQETLLPNAKEWHKRIIDFFTTQRQSVKKMSGGVRSEISGLTAEGITEVRNYRKDSVQLAQRVEILLAKLKSKLDDISHNTPEQYIPTQKPFPGTRAFSGATAFALLVPSMGAIEAVVEDILPADVREEINSFQEVGEAALQLELISRLNKAVGEAIEKTFPFADVGPEENPEEPNQEEAEVTHYDTEITGNGNARAAASTSSEVLLRVRSGQIFEIVKEIADGQAVESNSVWYQGYVKTADGEIIVDDKTQEPLLVWVWSGLTSDERTVTQTPTLTPEEGATSTPTPNETPQESTGATPAPVAAQEAPTQSTSNTTASQVEGPVGSQQEVEVASAGPGAESTSELAQNLERVQLESTTICDWGNLSIKIQTSDPTLKENYPISCELTGVTTPNHMNTLLAYFLMSNQLPEGSTNVDFGWKMRGNPDNYVYEEENDLGKTSLLVINTSTGEKEIREFNLGTVSHFGAMGQEARFKGLPKAEILIVDDQESIPSYLNDGIQQTSLTETSILYNPDTNILTFVSKWDLNHLQIYKHDQDQLVWNMIFMPLVTATLNQTEMDKLKNDPSYIISLSQRNDFETNPPFANYTLSRTMLDLIFSKVNNQLHYDIKFNFPE